MKKIEFKSKNKQGIFFTIDAILAAGIFVTVLILASNFYISDVPKIQVEFFSQDIVGIFTNLKVSDLNNPYVTKLIASGVITRQNSTVLEQIGEFWSENELELALNFTSNLTAQLIPEKFGFGLYIDGEPIYIRNSSLTGTLVSSRKIISGIAKDKPTYGFSSRAFLKSIGSKNTLAYAYFGGFVGQGNVSKQLELIPSDAIIISSFMEADGISDLKLYINGNYCDDFSPENVSMSPTIWNLSACNNFIIPGIKNNYSIDFKGLVNESYVGGGYIKVRYRTKELISNVTSGIDVFQFPGINGIINLYSSANIPGTLHSIDLFTHFYNNRTTYLNVGNDTIFESSGSSEDQIINISSISIPLSARTLPIRMGVRNLSEAYNITSGEPSDSILVTDVSGSMDNCGLTDTGEFCQYDCYWWIFYLGQQECLYTGSCGGDECGTCSSPRTTNNHQVVNQSGCVKSKMEMAIEADNLFVDTLLNVSGNKIGLVSYENDVDSIEPLSDIKLDLQTEINSYSASGGTCICCGINRAKDLLAASENKKFMVVMSDGDENRYCDNFNDYTGSGSGSVDAIDAGQNACNNNITVFAVGFGSDANEDTLKQVACDPSLYYNATNASKIAEIYTQIGNEILVIANFSSQIISVNGDFPESRLYPDSFISFNYTPIATPATHGEIELTMESEKFGSCTPTIIIPNDTRIIDSKILSYSGEHWTSYLSVNGNEIFDINDYGSRYEELGDPFALQVPVNFLKNGDNSIEVKTADNPINETGCSNNNSMIYKIAIKSSIDYGSPLSLVDGCDWTIELEDESISNLKAPSSYSGSDVCSFTSAGKIFDADDSYEVAVSKILEKLDFDKDGRLDISFDENDLELEYVTISNVPSLWGPAIVEIRVWE